MCSECGMLFCPPRCPGYDAPELPRCSECSTEVYPDETFRTVDGRFICSYCLDNMELFDVLRICEIDDVKTLLTVVLSHRRTGKGE